MPRFHFHLYNAVTVRDEEGRELGDLMVAKLAAIKTARRLIADDVVTRGEVTLSHRIEVEDQRGKLALTVRFGDAFRINP